MSPLLGRRRTERIPVRRPRRSPTGLPPVTTGLTVIEDFEAGNLDNYTISGDSQFVITDTFVREGNHALEMPRNIGGTNTAHSVTGLNSYPRRGNTFRVWAKKPYGEVGYTTRLMFAEQSAEGGWSVWGDGYMVEWTSNEEVVIAYNDQGDYQAKSSATSQELHPDGEWFYTDVKFDPDDDGTITAEVYDIDDTLLESVSINDTTYDVGSLVWIAAANMELTSWYDYAVKTGETVVNSTPIDTFDDGNLSEWTESSDASFQLQQNTVHDGSHALEVVAGQSGTDDISSGSGLSNYPSRGDRFRIRLFKDANTDPVRFMFAEQAAEGNWSVWGNNYMIESNDDLAVLKSDDGNYGAKSDSSGVDAPTGEWLDIDVDFDTPSDGTISAEMFDSERNSIGTASISDTEYDAGTLVIANASGMTNSHYFDSMKIL